jgi:microcystin-dependent protein
MAWPLLGEIRLFAGNYAPTGWRFCHGQLLDIATYDALFSLIGTSYGGDGQSTFALPDLRGRVPMHQGSLHPLAEFGGQEQVWLTAAQLPAHTHSVLAASVLGTTGVPTGNVVASVGGTTKLYLGTPPTPMASAAIPNAGGSKPHDNRMPSLALNFIIVVDSSYAIYPSPS